MLEISGKTNLLEQNAYKYSLQDVAEPNLQRDIYTQGAVPKVPFNHRRVPMNMPEEIWITDTSLRDGQQSVEPYTVDQIVNIYKYLSRLGGPYGIIRGSDCGLCSIQVNQIFVAKTLLFCCQLRHNHHRLSTLKLKRSFS